MRKELGLETRPGERRRDTPSSLAGGPLDAPLSREEIAYDPEDVQAADLSDSALVD
jgi:hypothetical protein